MKNTVNNLLFTRDILVYLRVMYNSAEDDSRCAQMWIVVMTKEVTVTKDAAKENGSSAVANMKLKYQIKLNTIRFKLKDSELDLGVEQKIREGINQEFDVAKNTVEKLRG